MKTVVFDDAYFRQRMYIAWRGPMIAQAIVAEFKPASVIDFGCSVGDIVAGLLELGIDAYGLDFVLPAHFTPPPDRLILGDLTQPLILPRQYDVGILMEVLSILPERSHAQVLVNVSAYCETFIVNHETTMPKWVRIDADASLRLRGELSPWKDKPAIKAWALSATVYRRKKLCST